MDKKILLTDILLKQGYITQDNLKTISSTSDEGKIEELISQEVISKEILGQAIGEYYKLKFVNLHKEVPKEEDVLKLSKSLATSLGTIFVEDSEKTVHFTTYKPQDAKKITDKLKTEFKGKKIELGFSFEDEVKDIFNYYRDPLQKRISKILEKSESIASDLFSELVNEAYEMKSSDIHIEPLSKNVIIRYRIDGILEKVGELNNDIFNNLLNRVKVLANLRLDEHLSAQDGAIRIDIDNVQLDLRISIVPTVNGQNIVIRILSSYIKNLGLSDLGLSELNEAKLNAASKKPYGMILTAGPTGSGKTTTLYSVLKLIHKPEVNITTIEDPVEYKIDGVNQIQVNDVTNLTFAKGLRSIVRQDPNVILVGEIRDTETVEISINAALTGHLLLSTFHANDAFSVIPRLIDMGAEPFLLSSTLSLIIAQRLARKICSNCKVSYDISHAELSKSVPNLSKVTKDAKLTLYKGKGCNSCHNTGYRGRVGIFEMLEIDSAIQEIILTSPSSKQIRDIAISNGMNTFEIEGIEKMLMGDVSLEELQRVILIDNKAANAKDTKTKK